MRALFVLLALLFAVPAAAQTAPPARATAVFAGGCFWCTESDFDHVAGVVSTTSGYTGGTRANPTYQNHGGHVEAVQVVYDPRRVSYRQLVDRFWRTVDPTDAGGQFCDRGPSYATSVFASTPTERAQAEQSKTAAQRALGRPIVTPIRAAGRFWTAEAYHQDYATRNALRYRVYRSGCGRDARLRSLWGGR